MKFITVEGIATVKFSSTQAMQDWEYDKFIDLDAEEKTEEVFLNMDIGDLKEINNLEDIKITIIE